MDKDKPIEPIFIGVDLAKSFDSIRYVQAEVSRAFCIPPKILYSQFKPYLVVDNTRRKT